MQKEIRDRYKLEIDEMIEDELRYQMIRQAEIETSNMQNKLSSQKQVEKLIKKRMTVFLNDASPDQVEKLQSGNMMFEKLVNAFKIGAQSAMGKSPSKSSLQKGVTKSI